LQNFISFIGLFCKRPIISSILLTEANPYLSLSHGIYTLQQHTATTHCNTLFNTLATHSASYIQRFVGHNQPSATTHCNNTLQHLQHCSTPHCNTMYGSMPLIFSGKRKRKAYDPLNPHHPTHTHTHTHTHIYIHNYDQNVYD